MKGHIVFAGNIGAGKTSLAKIVSEIYKLPFFEESVSDNPLLELFASNPQKYAFPLQHYFLASRIQAHLRASFDPQGAVQDRSVYEDADIFTAQNHAIGNISDVDFARYTEIFQQQVPFLRVPDLLVYLRTSVPILLGRIEERGREAEKGLLEAGNNYVAELNERYERWFEAYAGPKTVVETDNLNFVRDARDLTTTLVRVREALDDMIKPE